MSQQQPTPPTLARIVHYRGNRGLQTMRAAIVTATIDSLDLTGVERGDVPALTDDMHVHLWVWTPAVSGPNAAAGGFGEFDIPYGGPGPEIAPGTWTWPVIYARVERD